jgi:hypothetical protein
MDPNRPWWLQRAWGYDPGGIWDEMSDGWEVSSTHERAVRDMLTYTWIEERNTDDGLHNINCYRDPDNGAWLCHPHCTVPS